MATFLNIGGSFERATLGKRLGRHVAAALVLFTLLQIGVIDSMTDSFFMHLGTIAAIAGFALTSRALERNWDHFTKAGFSDMEMCRRFRIDISLLWAAAVLSPFLWIPVVIIYHAVLG